MRRLSFIGAAALLLVACNSKPVDPPEAASASAQAVEQEASPVVLDTPLPLAA